jgi:Domain of unknown function (DUF4129)
MRLAVERALQALMASSESGRKTLLRRRTAMAPNVRSEAAGRWSAAGLGAVLIALTAAVAVASRASTQGSGGPVGAGSGAAHALGSVVLALGVLVGMAVLALIVAVLWPSTLGLKRGSDEGLFAPYRPDMSRGEKAVLIGLLTVILGGFGTLVWVVVTHHGSPQPVALPQGAVGGFGGSPTRHHSTPAPAAGGGSSALSPVVVAAIVAVIAAGLAALFVRRRSKPTPEEVDRARAPLARPVEWSLDDLRREPDPRRAVIAAYARMERMFAAQGMGRRMFETPLEYLGRVLGQMHVNAASTDRLTGLFEEAKFSPHAIGNEERAQAVETLAAIHKDLERQ